MGQICCAETSVNKYQSTLHNVPKERSSEIKLDLLIRLCVRCKSWDLLSCWFGSSCGQWRVSGCTVVLAVYDAASVAARFLTDAASQPRRMGSFVLDSQYIIINSSGGLGIEIHGNRTQISRYIATVVTPTKCTILQSVYSSYYSTPICFGIVAILWKLTPKFHLNISNNSLQWRYICCGVSSAEFG
jgi:hypothetical protein